MSGDQEDRPGYRPGGVPVALAAAAGGVLAERLGGPGGAAIGGAATVALTEIAVRAWDEFRPDSQRRQAEMLGYAGEALNRDPEGLGDLIGESERTRLLTATAMVGAAGTAWPPKVAALGRALADGLIADGDEINLADLVVPAMTDMDRAHVSLLDLLVRWLPVDTIGSPVHMRPYERMAGYREVDWWDAGPRVWSAAQVGRARAALRLALPSLMGTLQRHGLAGLHDNSPGLLAKYSERMQDEAARAGPRAGQRVTASNFVPRVLSELDAQSLIPASTWSPTELGERVLGYYELAAAQFDSPDR